MDIFSGTGLACVRGERVVFEGVNFGLAEGDALYLTGINGAGKSSLLRIMATLLAPAAGILAWRGEDVAGNPRLHASRLAYVGHLDAVKPVLSVAENLAFWAAMAGVEPHVRRDAVNTALTRLGLVHLAGAPARYLSAGQRRRLALARLAAVPASLWLLDEPQSGVDAAGVAALDGLLDDHLAAGGMAVIATHDPVPERGREMALTGSAA